MQVKFRGKIINEPNGILNGQWQYGSFIQEPNGICRIRKYIKNASGSHNYSEYQVDPESLGMFTGLHDKNGNEIYGPIGAKGGDIVKSFKNFTRPFSMGCQSREVKFENGSFKIGSVNLSILDQKFQPEVVGTVIDNPELLGQ